MNDLSGGACAGMADATFARSDPFYPGDEDITAAESRSMGSKKKRPEPDYTEAAAVCDRCPITAICLREALTETVQWGYRGGKPPEDREALNRGKRITRRPRLTEAQEHQRMRAYNAGWSDRRIADLTGLSAWSIRSWRSSRALPANHTADGRGLPRERVPA